MTTVLDRTAIAALMPHRGTMCLLDSVSAFDAQSLTCRANSHRQPNHPMRLADRLGSACLIEYAAQAMALHAGLCADSAHPATPDGGHGVIAAVRRVNLYVDRLDAVPGDLEIAVRLESGDAASAIYAFDVFSEARPLADGRLTVVFTARV